MVNGRVFAYQDVGNGPVQQIPWFARADRLVHDDGALHEGVDVTGVVVGARRREHSLYRDVRIHPVNVGGPRTGLPTAERAPCVASRWVP